MTRAVVTENTSTLTAKPNFCHTIRSSRNRFSWGDRLGEGPLHDQEEQRVDGHQPHDAKPTATSISVTWVLATVDPV